MRETVRECLRLLDKSVRECCREKEVGLVFSAGLDSTLMGVLASRHSKVRAYSVGVEGSHDLDCARKIRKKLPFEVNRIELSESEIEGELLHMVSIIKSHNPLDVSVGMPFYYASKKAYEDGVKTMLCGQGGDELFGGYNRYIELLGGGTYSQLEELMEKDLQELPESNLKRDKKICKANGVKLEIPLLNRKFIEYVKKIPIRLKVRELAAGEASGYGCVDKVNGRRFVRKYIEREIAREAGVPDEVIQRGKKAAQYGSGSQKTLERLARKNGFKKKAAQTGRRDYTRMYLESMLKQRFSDG